jgi:hypothetical protein
MVKKIAYRLYLVISALIIIGTGTAIAWGMHFGASQLPLRQYFPRDYTNAIWDWSNPLAKSPQDLKELADFLYLHQLNVVYVDVGQYEKILTGASRAENETFRQEFEAALEQYITALQKREVKVYAAAGNVQWSDPSLQHIPIGILKAVQSYNAAHPDARFAGVEFDIEAYNQEGFAEGSATVKSLVLTDFLDLVDQLATLTGQYNQQNSHTLALGFAIPYWFDNQNGNIPSVTWRNKTGPTLFHLLDRLNHLKDSNIVVMAYRNAARGNDGVIAHSRTEVEYAQAKAPNVAVLIGQEVNEVEPAKITYYGESVTELSSQVKVITDEFKGTPTFQGIAINDLAGFKELEDQDTSL